MIMIGCDSNDESRVERIEQNKPNSAIFSLNGDIDIQQPEKFESFDDARSWMTNNLHIDTNVASITYQNGEENVFVTVQKRTDGFYVTEIFDMRED